MAMKSDDALIPQAMRFALDERPTIDPSDRALVGVFESDGQLVRSIAPQRRASALTRRARAGTIPACQRKRKHGGGR